MLPTGAGELPVSDNIDGGRSSFSEKCRQRAWQLLPYAGAVALSCLLLVIVLQLWKADLRIPFEDQSDAVWVNSWIKCVQETGWFLHNPLLGAPGGSDLYEFPMSENLHFLIIKLLTLVLHPSGLVFNVYVLLMYPLTACTALYVLRRLSVSTGLALVGSLLFAFLPYHLFRGFRHIFIASYYLAPLQILMVLMLARASGSAKTGDAKLSNSISGKALLGMLFVSLLVSGAGVYCAFFGCFFLLLAGIYAVVQWGNWKNLGIACLLCLWTSVMTVANLAPSILYNRAHGFNTQAVRRIHFESELYAFKPVQLVLPVIKHRIPLLANLKARYVSQGLLINENDSASLGLIGSIGFVLLLAQFLRRKNQVALEPGETMQSLAVFNGGALLLGTIGGIGSLFSLLGSPWIRGYNRVSVYIGFLGIAAVLLLLDPILARLCNGPRRAWLYTPLLLALLALGIFDQTTPEMHANYPELKAEFKRRKEFVQGLEAGLPRGAKIFQLPYTSYPEFTGYCWSDGSDPLKPYLFSSSLRWSFGAVRGREGDSQNLMLATSPPPILLEKLVLAGYDGLFIDRLAYSDLAQDLVNHFTGLLGMPPIYGDKLRWVFFPLEGYRQKLRGDYSSEEWNQLAAEYGEPVVPLFGKGFDLPSGPSNALSRSCLNRAELFLSNPGNSDRDVEVELEAERSYSPASLQVQCGTVHKAMALGPKPQSCRFRVTVPPGKTRMLFTCDGPDYVGEGGDSRQYFKIQSSYRLLNFQVTPVCSSRLYQLSLTSGVRSAK